MASEDVIGLSISMGRRERRRQREGVIAEKQSSESERARVEKKREDTVRPQRPPAPWGSAPLTELAVFIALVCGVIGLIVWGLVGQAMIAGAVVLGMLAGLELAIREHFAGYRSHSTLLAGLPAIVVFTVLTLLIPGREGFAVVLKLAVALLVFAPIFYFLRTRFKSLAGRSWR